MKLLFAFWGRRGGGAKYSLELSRELKKISDLELHLSISKYCDLIDQFDELNLPSYHVNTYKSLIGFFRNTIFKLPLIIWRIKKYIKDNKIDVLIFGMSHLWSPWVLTVSRKIGVKTFLIIHEPAPHPNENYWMSLFLKKSIELSIMKADKRITLTEKVRDEIYKKYGFKEVFVVPHGVFSYYRALKPRSLNYQNDLRLLFFGRITYYKGLDILLEALEQVQIQYPNVVLGIYGSGDIDPYNKMISRLRNVQIVNHWLSEDEIIKVFRSFDVCVLPYRQANQSGIIGIAFQAAMPVISTPEKGLIEQTKFGGVIISDSHKPEDLARSIIKIIERPDLYKKLSLEALEYTSKLSWSAIAKRVFEIVAK